MVATSRRNFIFRVSIVINVAVLLYAAMHLSGNGSPGLEWTLTTGDGADRTEFRYLNRERLVNDTPPESSLRNIEESTSSKPSTHAPPQNSTVAAINKTTSSTASNVDQSKNRDKAVNTVTSEAEVGNDTVALEILDEDSLAEQTLGRLQALLQCNERGFEPSTEQRGEFWVLKNYVRAEHGPLACYESVTYTTHAGFEFLDNVQPLVQRWMAPISLAIHAPGSDFAPTVNSIRYLRDCLGSDLVRQFVTFHIFFSYKHIPSKISDPETFLSTPYNCTEKPPYNVNASSTYMKEKSLLYPVNVARNIARDSALTYFLLPSDIELYPSPNLAARFLNMIARNAKPLNTSTNPRVFPISIFEVDAKVQVPSTKTELRAMLSKKTAIPFHKYVCPNCHNIPQGQQWMNANETNQMDVFHVGKRRGKYVHWEPIFIGTHKEPHYDERLSWEGKQDKMTQGYILCVKDYDFMILNNAFLIHKPGIKRYVRNKKRDAIAGKQGSFVKNRIMPELKKLFGTRSGCAL